MYKLKGIILFSIFAVLFPSLVFTKDLELTVIYDNNSYNEELETRWGFSCLVEGLDKTILFDVGGEGSVLLKNMEKLKIDPGVVDIIVLSHIHYDHIGGLSDFLKKTPNVTIYMPRSLPQRIKNKVKQVGAKLVEVHKPIEICKNAYSTGELGNWIKEESLIIKTSKGLVIITGCAHPGIVDIVKGAKEMFKNWIYPVRNVVKEDDKTYKNDFEQKRGISNKVYLVLGGFHLCWMNIWQVKNIVKGVKEQGVSKVAPCHCSGNLARKVFKKVYGKDFILSGVGKRIKIDDAF